MIKGLYILSVHGQPIYFYNKQGSKVAEIEDATLFSGMISAIQGFMQEMDVGTVENFQTEKNRMLIKTYENVVLVLLTDPEDNYSTTELNNLFAEIKKDTEFLSVSEDVISLSKSENMLLNKIIETILEKWSKKSDESKAAKKLKDELW